MNPSAAISSIREMLENVGPAKPGEVMTGHVDGIYDINVKVV